VEQIRIDKTDEVLEFLEKIQMSGINLPRVFADILMDDDTVTYPIKINCAHQGQRIPNKILIELQFGMC